MKLQHNHTTGKEYQGKNQANLLSAKEERGFESSAWLTFLQARDSKLKIKKGSKGVTIFKGYSKFSVKDKEGKIEEKTGSLGYARVFNLDQTEKYKKEAK